MIIDAHTGSAGGTAGPRAPGLITWREEGERSVAMLGEVEVGRIILLGPERRMRKGTWQVELNLWGPSRSVWYEDNQADARAALSAAVAEWARRANLAPDRGWRPIDEAAKSGGAVDLWITPPRGSISGGDYGRAADCWYAYGEWRQYCEGEEGGDSCFRVIHNATHWMPRPAWPSHSHD